MAQDNSYQTTITFVVVVFLVLLGVLLRILARKITNQPLKSDDWFITASAAFSIGFAIVYPFSNLFGNGKHVYLLRPDQISNYLRTIYVSEQIYGPSITLTKLSILAFYRRVFPKKSFRQITHVLGAVSVAWLFTNAFLTAFQCDPVRKAWMPEIPGTCVNSFSIIFIGIQVPNIVLDLVIIALPVREVARLQLSPSKKYSVIAIFLLGSFGVIASILRLAFTITRIGAEDVTHNTEIGNWTLIEAGVQLFSACLPTLYPLARIRIDWNNLRSRLSLSKRSDFASNTRGSKRSVFPLKGQPDYRKDQTPENSQPSDYRGKARTWSSNPSRKERDGSTATDAVPLRAMQVRHDIEQTKSAGSGECHAR